MEGTDKDVVLTLWHKRLLSFGGMWPADKRDLRFYICFGYILAHTCMVISDLLLVIGQFGMMNNIRELAILFITLGKIVPLKFSTALYKIMHKHNLKGDPHYKNDEERRVYLSFIGSGVTICKFNLYVNGLLGIVLYTKSLQIFVSSEISGGPPVYRLPYHTRRFFNFTHTHTYFAVYACSAPMMYGFFFDCLIGSTIASMIIDLSGQLAVLSYRIRSLKVGYASMELNSLEITLREVVEKHTDIIKTCKVINATFNHPLFFELIATTFVQGIVMYNIILNSSSLHDPVALFLYVLYISAALLLMLHYCIAGTIILEESINFHNSWYECDWYEMPHRSKTLIIICMIRARNPLNLNGAGFYIYSLESFTGIVKSSVAYVSMLRQLV